MRGRQAFFETMASMLGAGIPVKTALEQSASDFSGALGLAVARVRDAVAEGRPVSEGMRAAGGVFRPFELELVRASESTGALGRAFATLAAEEERSTRVRGRLWSGVLYPLAVLHFVPVPLNIARLVNGSLLGFVFAWAGMLLPFWIAAAVVAVLWRRRRQPGPARLLAAIPLVGGVIERGAWIRWGRTYAALEDAGIRADAAIERAAATVPVPHLAIRLARPAAAVSGGTSRTEAFGAVPLPLDYAQALKTGEHAGSIPESIMKVAEAREFSLLQTIDRIVKMMPVVTTILAGIAVLYVAFNILGGYYAQIDGL